MRRSALDELIKRAVVHGEAIGAQRLGQPGEQFGAAQRVAAEAELRELRQRAPAQRLDRGRRSSSELVAGRRNASDSARRIAQSEAGGVKPRRDRLVAAAPPTDGSAEAVAPSARLDDVRLDAGSSSKLSAYAFAAEASATSWARLARRRCAPRARLRIVDGARAPSRRRRGLLEDAYVPLELRLLDQ